MLTFAEHPTTPPTEVTDLAETIEEDSWDLKVEDSSGNTEPGTYVNLQDAYDAPEQDLLGGNCYDFSMLVHQDYLQDEPGWDVALLKFTEYAHAALVYTPPDGQPRWVVDITFGQFDPDHQSKPAVFPYNEWKTRTCQIHQQRYGVQLVEERSAIDW